MGSNRFILPLILLLAAPMPFLSPASHAQAPETPMPTLDAARQLFEDGKWTDALQAFRSIRTDSFISKRAGVCLYYEGWCLFNMENYKEAAATFEQLTANHPDFNVVPEAALKIAECQAKLKEYDKAIASFRAFRQRFAQHELAARAVLGEAWCYQEQQKFDEAGKLLRAIIQQTRDSETRLDAQFMLAQVLTDQKDYKAARKVFEDMARNRYNPRVADALYSAGEAMYAIKQYEDAAAYYKRVVPRAALLRAIDNQIEQLKGYLTNPAYQDRRVQIIAQVRALVQLRRRHETREDVHPRSLIRIANCYQQLGQWDEASVVYEHFLRIYSKDSLPATMHDLVAQAEFGYGQMLNSRGLSDAAKAQFERFNRLYHDHPLARGAVLNIADKLLAENRYAEALDMFKAVRESAKSPAEIEAADFQVGACHFGLRQWPQALASYQAFLAAHPDSNLIPRALFQLGRIEIEQAAQALQEQRLDAYRSYLTNAVQYFEMVQSKHAQKAADLMRDVMFQLGYLYSWLSQQDPAYIEKTAGAFRGFLDLAGQDTRVAEATYQLARAHTQLRKWDLAVASYREIIDRQAGTDQAVLAAWEIAAPHAELGQTDQMLAALRFYAQTYPNAKHAGDAWVLVGGHLEQQARTMASRNQTAETQAKLDEALAAYRRLIQDAISKAPAVADHLLNPAVAAVLRVSAILQDRKDVDGAYKECETFLDRFIASPIAVSVLVAELTRIGIRSGQLEAAHDRLSALTDRYKDKELVRIAALTGTIDLALAERNRSRALEAAEQLLSTPSQQLLGASNLAAIGAAFVENERHERALDTLGKARVAMRDMDKSLDCLISLRTGQAQFGLKSLDQALETLSAVVASCGDNAALREQAELDLARIREAKGDTDAAAKLYRKLIGGRGRVATDAAYYAGEMHFRLARSMDGAMEPARQKQRSEQYHLARVYFLRSIPQTAGVMKETATYRTAQCHEGLQSLQTACDAYKLYAARFPNGQFIAEARNRIDALCQEPK
jgi:TolA-binding protein